MSAIHVFQNGREVMNNAIVIGAPFFPVFDGSTTTWAWAFTQIPVGSAAVMNDAATPAPSALPDQYGQYAIQFTDDASNVFTATVGAQSPVGPLLDVADDDNGRSYYMADTANLPGKRLAYFGQNTDAANLGGGVAIASGAGNGSGGVQLGQRVPGNQWAIYVCAEFSAQGGVQGIQDCEGGSSGNYTFNMPSALAHWLATAITTEFLLDAGTRHLFRTAGGGTLGDTTLLELNGTKIGFYGATPVVQATRPGQLTDSTGGAVDGTLVDVSILILGTQVAQASKTNNNFADVCDRLNKLEAIVKNLGLSA